MMNFRRRLLLILLITLPALASAEEVQPLNLDLPIEKTDYITDFGTGQLGTKGNKTTQAMELQKLIIVVSNDFFSANTSDRHFTSRIRLGAIQSQVPDELQHFFENNEYIIMTLSQDIYTPEDLDQVELIEDDRPYAGWLYATIGKLKQVGNQLEVSTVDIGVVGPNSLAEESQKEIHRLIDSSSPRGWDNQLQNEVGINIHHDRYVSIRRAILGVVTGELIRTAGFSAGNIRTSLRLGSIFRVGYNLPNDIAAGLDRNIGRNLSVFAFVIFAGELVLRDIFLDGNTLEDSHSVESENLIGNIVLGLTAQKGAFGVSLTHTFQSKTFEGQDGHNTFAEIRLLFHYFIK